MKNSITSEYLSGEKKIDIPNVRRSGNGKSLFLRGACGNNLKNIDVEFQLGKLICVTGVSGSGKSSLINQTLYPLLSREFYNSNIKPLKSIICKVWNSLYRFVQVFSVEYWLKHPLIQSVYTIKTT